MAEGAAGMLCSWGAVIRRGMGTGADAPSSAQGARYLQHRSGAGVALPGAPSSSCPPTEPVLGETFP